MANILILSVGTRNKIIQYFKRNFNQNGKVIVTDCSSLAPALYEADSYYIVPRMIEDGYIDVILSICEKEDIKGILSLIDPELSLLAKYKDEFRKIGTMIIGSSFEVCERCLDKFEMYQWLKEYGYDCAKSYTDIEGFVNDVNKEKISFPVFVKPAKGSASIAISKVNDMETLKLLFERSKGLMIQEFLEGQEIGADVYIDMISKKVVSIFTKKKLVMRAGETDKSVSFKDEKLFELIKKFTEEFGFEGQIDIDIFDVNDKYYISEVNPRFGGGYPHAYECGGNHMKLICKNLEGSVNTVSIGEYKDDVYMMKYNELLIK